MRRTSKLLLTLGEGTGPLHRRLYRRMRGLILDGSWPVGTRLPSSRVLAEELGVSRNTALHALELLVADGWVRSRRGAAMYVSSNAPQPVPRLSEASSREPPRMPVPLEIGRQTAEFFPLERWNRLQVRLLEEAGAEILYGTDAGGLPRLCSAIAAYVGESRALPARPDQVIVVSSTQTAIDLIARVTATAGEKVWIEDPGYPLAHQLFRTNGLVPVAVPVDEEGLRVEEGIAIAPDARLAYVTPACQFPTGRTMSTARRRALLDWAARHDAWIIEDDWEWHAQFRTGAAAKPPLQARRNGERVIYVQTFNRTIFPGLRMAFLIAPKELAADLLDLHERVSGGPNVAIQATLAHFLEQGLYAAHLRVTRTAYGERREALLEALRGLPPGFEVQHRRGGLHLVVTTPPNVDDARLASTIRARGIACMGMSEFALSANAEGGLILGFAAFTPDELKKAGSRLVAALREAIDDH